MIFEDEHGHGRSETLGDDAAILEFELDSSEINHVQKSPEEAVRSTETIVLIHMLLAGALTPIWVELARAELVRRGIQPPSP